MQADGPWSLKFYSLFWSAVGIHIICLWLPFSCRMIINKSLNKNLHFLISYDWKVLSLWDKLMRGTAMFSCRWQVSLLVDLSKILKQLLIYLCVYWYSISTGLCLCYCSACKCKFSWCLQYRFGLKYLLYIFHYN